MSAKFVDKIRLLTFDVTGTLINFRLEPAAQYVDVGKMHGLNLSIDDVQKALKTTLKKVNGEHPCFGKRTGLHWKTWWYEVVSQTLTASVKPLKLETSKIDAIASHLISGYCTGSYYKVYPNVESTLEYLMEKNITLGVISNFDERLHVVLKELELDKYFKFILTSYGTGYEKPSQEIFLQALGSGDNVLPQFCFHVGNSPELDFLAAKNYGWHAALVHVDKASVVKQFPQIPSDLIFQDFFELKSHLS